MLALLCVCDVANVVTAAAPSLGVDAVAWMVREGSLNAVFGLKKCAQAARAASAREVRRPWGEVGVCDEVRRRTLCATGHS